MKPDKTNYEIWFADWLDGSLDEVQVSLFLSFIEENPDLKEELFACSSLKLTPRIEEYKHKKLLKKEPVDIPDKQFEYLCVGHIENNLSKELEEELQIIVSSDDRRKNELELFGKTKLAAPDIRFSAKNRLLRTTPFQKALKISATLVAAASIVLFIITFPFASRNNANNLPQLTIVEKKEKSGMIPEIPLSNTMEETHIAEQTVKNIPVSTNNKYSEVAIIEKENNMDTIFFAYHNEPIESIKVLSISDVNLTDKTDSLLRDILLPLKAAYTLPVSELAKPKRNLAQIFREKILKEKTLDNSPVKMYELAEAGVVGLNKLLGWEMDFRKNNDEKGEIKSISFNSRLLTVHAPINKNKPE